MKFLPLQFYFLTLHLLMLYETLYRDTAHTCLGSRLHSIVLEAEVTVMKELINADK